LLTEGVIARALLRCCIAVGVCHPARFACLGNWSNRSFPSALGAMSAPESFQSRVVVVVQPARRAASSDVCAAASLSSLCHFWAAVVVLALSAASCFTGVGQPVSCAAIASGKCRLMPWLALRCFLANQTLSFS
jgi:hypothetical protein